MRSLLTDEQCLLNCCSEFAFFLGHSDAARIKCALKRTGEFPDDEVEGHLGSRGYDQLGEERGVMAVSFAGEILPLFRVIDIDHMKPRQVFLDDYAYMSDAAGDDTYPDHAHARNVYCYLTGDCTPQMPPGGPFWSREQLALFNQWMTDGFQP